MGSEKQCYMYDTLSNWTKLPVICLYFFYNFNFFFFFMPVLNCIIITVLTKEQQETLEGLVDPTEKFFQVHIMNQLCYVKSVRSFQQVDHLSLVQNISCRHIGFLAGHQLWGNTLCLEEMFLVIFSRLA